MEAEAAEQVQLLSCIVQQYERMIDRYRSIPDPILVYSFIISDRSSAFTSSIDQMQKSHYIPSLGTLSTSALAAGCEACRPRMMEF
jgi:hypothetical protein